MKRKAAVLPYVLIAPTLLFVVVFTIFPLIKSIFSSLYIQRLNLPKYRDPLWTGLGNFRKIFHDEVFLQVLSNTAVYIAILVPLCVVTAFLFALMLHSAGRSGVGQNNQIGGKLKGLYRTAFFYPTVIPMVSAATIWMFFFTPGYGLFNKFLEIFGYHGAQNWIANPNLALFAIIITAFWKSAGYYMIFYLAGLQNLPQHVFEAAKLDGAGPFRTLFSITLPLLKRTNLFVITVTFIGAFQSVDHVFVLTGGGPSDRSSLLLFHLWQVRFENLNVGEASAITVVLVVFLLVFTITNFVFSEQKER